MRDAHVDCYRVQTSLRIFVRAHVHTHTSRNSLACDTFPIMNPLARTRVYTDIVGHRGCGMGQIELFGVASVMLQVQCISLPKRFVPSVSKCLSVVRSALTSPSALPSFSLFLSRFVSQSVGFLCSLNLFPALGKRRANVPLLLPHAQLTRTHTRAVSMLAPKLSALHQRNSDELA